MTRPQAPPAPERVSGEWARVRDHVIGASTLVPTADGVLRRHAHLDHAATTPAMRGAWEVVADLLPWYGSVNRGGGAKSSVMNGVYEDARETVLRFVGADPAAYDAVFVKHTTEGLNLLAQRLHGPDTTAVTNDGEHHSNLLPWLRRGPSIRLPARADGVIPLEEFEAALVRAESTPVLAVTGASNVTGWMPPLRDLAHAVHGRGGLIVVDAAQLIAHRPLTVAPGPAGDDWLDAVVFSGHKAYAPFGAGVVVVRRELLERGAPLLHGGGMASAVDADGVRWAPPPHSDEGGSPNVLGAAALAVAVRTLDELGLDAVATHEQELWQRLRDGLAGVPGIRLLGEAPAGADRVAIVPFTMDGWDAGQLAARLSADHGLALRGGRFCAHPLVDALGDGRPAPGGAVRASLGLASHPDDVARLVAALQDLSDEPAAARSSVELPPRVDLGAYAQLDGPPARSAGTPPQPSVHTSSEPRS